MGTDYSTISFSPQQVGRLSLETLDSLRKDSGGGIKTGVTDIDKFLMPFRPGELITVLGLPSHYKSGVMNWFSKQAVKEIKAESNEIVIRVTWEQSVEEDTISWLAGAADMSITKLARGLIDETEWKILKGASVRRAITPMWIVGHSQQESKERRRARPRMTMPDVNKAIEFILNDATASRHKPKMIVLDYLQRIKPTKEDGFDRRIQVSNAVDSSKDMAISFGCPVVLGVQVDRSILSRDNKLPTMSDGQETSNIEQTSDKMLSVWYPIKTEPEGEMIGGETVTKNLLMMKLLKQKLGESNKTFALYIDPEKNLIGDRAQLTTAL